MKYNLNWTFIYTLITSGIAYVMTYVITTSKYTDTGAVISLILGLCVYLIIRAIYKKNEDFDKLSAKAYRLIVWLVPLLLITTHLILSFIEPGDKPQFIEFYTLDDLSWSGPFAAMLWPFLNLMILLANFVEGLWMLLYYLGTPVFIGLTILVLALLVTLFRKFIRLKQESVVQFSLSLATLYVSTPIIGYALCVYLWF